MKKSELTDLENIACLIYCDLIKFVDLNQGKRKLLP